MTVSDRERLDALLEAYGGAYHDHEEALGLRDPLAANAAQEELEKAKAALLPSFQPRAARSAGLEKLLDLLDSLMAGVADDLIAERNAASAKTWGFRQAVLAAASDVVIETDAAGEAMVCRGCGTTRSVAGIQACMPEALTCCPERKMVPVREELARIQAELRRYTERPFPILGGPSIPWRLIAPFESQALSNHGQSLERLAHRGGLDMTEAMAVMTMRPLWGIKTVGLDDFTAFVRAREAQSTGAAQ